MQNGYYNAVGGMITSFNRLDVVTNNLANVNTPSFKKDNLIIGDYIKMYDEKRKELPLDNHTKEGAKFLNRTLDRVPQVVEQYTDFSMRTLKRTENKLDLVLNKSNLFFSTKDTRGNIVLSKKGNLTIDATNRIVDKSSGNPIMGKNNEPIRLQKEDRVTIDTDGNIYQDNAIINKIQIYEVNNLKYLEKQSDGLYKPLKKDIYSLVEYPNAVQQGFLEGSNVNPVIAMTNLIIINRSIEFNQKAMTTQMDDMNNDAINKIAVVKN
jgi:flagellar basal-body rod protein FlgG